MSTNESALMDFTTAAINRADELRRSGQKELADVMAFRAGQLMQTDLSPAAIEATFQTPARFMNTAPYDQPAKAEFLQIAASLSPP